MRDKELKSHDFTDSLNSCYEDIKPFLSQELNRLREALIALPETATEEELLAEFERCVNALNDLDGNEELKSGIDTVEREALCDALYNMGDIVGLDAETEYVDNWRDW